MDIMEAEAESSPLVTRANLSGNGLRAARTVHFAKNAATAHAGAAAPASAAVFELEEDESGPLVDRGTGAERRGDAAPAAEREGMPLWVIPLLTAAVRRRCQATRLRAQLAGYLLLLQHGRAVCASDLQLSLALPPPGIGARPQFVSRTRQSEGVAGLRSTGVSRYSNSTCSWPPPIAGVRRQLGRRRVQAAGRGAAAVAGGLAPAADHAATPAGLHCQLPQPASGCPYLCWASSVIPCKLQATNLCTCVA